MSGATLPSQNEIDAQTSAPVLVCFDDSGTRTEAFARKIATIDNATGSIISSVKQYTTDGINWSVTPPAGTPTIGGCRGTKVLAVERFYYNTGLPIPASHVAYWGGDTLANSYSDPALDATNVYMHTSIAIITGSGTNYIGTDLLPYTAGSSQAAVLLTDVATIQAMIDAQMSVMGLTIGDAIYAVTTDNQPVVFLSPAAIALLASSTYLHAYIGETNIANNYDAKISFNILSPYTSTDVSLTTYNGDCIEVELIKELQTDGTETYRWVTRDGAGLLVPASSIITGFDEALVTTECPQAKPAAIIAQINRASWIGISTQKIPTCRHWSYFVRAGTVTVDGASRVAGSSFSGAPLSYGEQLIMYPSSTVVLDSGAIFDVEWFV